MTGRNALRRSSLPADDTFDKIFLGLTTFNCAANRRYIFAVNWIKAWIKPLGCSWWRGGETRILFLPSSDSISLLIFVTAPAT